MANLYSGIPTAHRRYLDLSFLRNHGLQRCARAIQISVDNLAFQETFVLPSIVIFVLLKSVALILVIDDDESLRHMISNGLVALGHEVLQAESGRQALAKFGSSKIDLVITDILLPDRDGLELIPDFRKLSPSTKIIAISGGGRVGPKAYLGTAKMLGADKTLAKPFSPLELQKAVADLLPGEM